jgi:outer membrane protein OmpA-like peptidoglycan-associated protein
MSITLIDAVKSVFTDPLIAKFSTLLGETEGNTRKAVNGAIPMILTSILQKAAYTEGATKIYDLSKQAAGSDLYGHIHELNVSSGGLSAGSALLTKGGGFARELLTDRTDAVVKEISRYAGVTMSSASFVTGVVSFAALDSVGRNIANANLDVKGMVAWLAIQRDTVIHAIPGGLQVKQALGIDHYPGDKVAKDTRRTSLFVILALIVILVVLFFGYRSCNQSSATNTTNTADTLPPPPPQKNAGPVQDTLPNGSVITVDNGGTEDRLIGFLNDPNAKIDSKNGNWFDFTRVNFASKSPDLLLESETQLKNIVAILNAFPKAKIKIGGFSDNTGDSVDNVKLSQQRADNVLAKLKELGAKGSQLTGAKGYGPDMPIGDNGTEAGRALNRRMSIEVKDK